MKSGYSAGIVAGFITGIASLIFAGIGSQLLAGFSLSIILALLPFTAVTHIGFNLIYGGIFGILFSKFYDVIPGKSGFRKGLVWGLIYAIVPEWWITSYNLAQGFIPIAIVWAYCGLIVILCYGPPLGYLYEGSQQPVKAEDKRKHKPIAGIIAGLVGGVVAAVLVFIQFIMGIPYLYHGLDVLPALRYPGYPLFTSITNVVAIEFILMFFWGMIFSVIFVMLYARLPGKNVMKGLYYGLLLILLSILYFAIWGLAYTYSLQAVLMAVAVCGLAFISFGIVLGYFYKR
jgi:hypothetical protein